MRAPGCGAVCTVRRLVLALRGGLGAAFGVGLVADARGGQDGLVLVGLRQPARVLLAELLAGVDDRLLLGDATLGHEAVADLVEVGTNPGRLERTLAAFQGVVADDTATVHVAHQVHPCAGLRSEEHTSELQSLMRISYAVFCLKKKKN